MKPALRLLALLAFCLCLCAPARAQEEAGAPLPVVASFSILGDIVREVGGPDIALETIVGPGTDTHGYVPTPTDAKTIAAAAIVFVNGLGFDTGIEKMARAAGSGVMVIPVTEGLDTRTMIEDGRRISDPHAWQSVANVRQYVRVIASALAARMPEKADVFATRAEDYDEKLASLDTEIHLAIDKIPAQKRKIITAHDAFGYFGAAYGVTFMAPAGIGEAEPTAADVAKLITQIKTEGVDTLFLETAINPSLMEQIAKDTGAKIGGTLYPDALSKSDGPAATYIDLMRYNLGLMRAGMQ